MKLPRLRAPAEHGQALVVPAFDQVGAMLQHNQGGRRSVNTFQLSMGGKSLNGVRELARQEIFAASAVYHREAGESVPDAAGESWFVAGHQPELFHPGVWFKNFVLQKLARQHGGLALNLVIDTDSAKPAVLHAPAEDRLARVPFDLSSTETPYEERKVEDEALFADLPERMKSIFARWNFEPMLNSYWREAMQQGKRTSLLGERLAAARRAVERRWGCVQREAPMSRVCQTEAFAWFADAIMRRLPEFHAIYNQTVHAYRREHGIRSRSHPVPDLARDGDWLEAPFWAWRQGKARRGKLFVSADNSAMRLRVGGEDWPTLPTTSADAVQAWRSLETQGYKVRSRALTTTMFVRVFLADVFVHGIGGGIYDELTDRIIERFFGFPAPGFLTVSATLLLPLPRFPQAAEQARELARLCRDLIFKPEIALEEGPASEPLIRAKKDWIRRAAATHAERVERFEQIRAINAQLALHVQPLIQETRMSMEACRQQSDWNAVAGRRDYAFCLYPEEMLKAFFLADIST